MTCKACEDKAAHYVPCGVCGYHEEHFDGDQRAENDSYELNSRYDSVSEAWSRAEAHDNTDSDPDYGEDPRLHWEDGRLVSTHQVWTESDDDIPF